MAHSHAHAHEETESTFFLDQLCTIAVAGLLGFTAVMMYKNGGLQRINLIERFHLPVLIGGIALLVMVILRAFSVWKLSGQVRAANTAEVEPPHEHDENCSHNHGAPAAVERHDHGHAHSHGHEHSHSHGQEPAKPQPAEPHGHDDHDHGWSPWRYAVLIVPFVLFALGLPTAGFNKSRLDNDLKEETLDAGTATRRIALAQVAGSMALTHFKKSGKPVNLKFSELSVHASRQASREYFEGRTVILTGMFHPLPEKDNAFKLYRVKVNCCGADAITLQSMILAPAPLQGFNEGDWVQIEGDISFQQIAGRNEWLPVIQLSTMKGIQKIQQPTNQFDDV